MVVDDAIDMPYCRVRAEPVGLGGRPSETPDGSAEPRELANDFARHTPILLASARALMRNEADARDLVQTTLEIGTRKLADLRDPAALEWWLLTIQVREAFRLRRRIGRFIRLTPEIAEAPTSPGPDADVVALRAALSKLSTRMRAAVVLHYLADLPVSDVARAMGISENTTKGHLKAGLARLREELKDE